MPGNDDQNHRERERDPISTLKCVCRKSCTFDVRFISNLQFRITFSVKAILVLANLYQLNDFNYEFLH